ncbi:MAG: hypothetical protein QXK06_05650 [Candidatus Diapherotrites archaeon]
MAGAFSINLKLVSRIAILLFLVFLLLFVLTLANRVKCKSIPGWCEVYYAIRGKPEVLIVYGESGLGDPELLADKLRDPNLAGAPSHLLRLDSVNPGNLKKYQLVIVTKARKMSSAKIKMFLDYAATGGNLVWTGDAGAEPESEDELLRENEYYEDSNSKAIINPWARKYEGYMVLLNKAISANYITNYCSIKRCSIEEPYYAGLLKPIERDNPLVYGFGPLQLMVTEGEDFAIVESLSEGTSTTVLTIDFGANLVAENKNYGNHLPMIVSSADASILGQKIGENIFYYAMPPEYYASEKLPKEKRYGLFIKNLYYGILYG